MGRLIPEGICTIRTCIDCKEDISSSHGNTIRCFPCYKNNKRVKKREQEERRRERLRSVKVPNTPYTIIRPCLDCKKDTHFIHRSSVRCDLCRIEKERARNRNREARRRTKLLDLRVPTPATAIIQCQECGSSREVPYSSRPHTKFCEACSAIRLARNSVQRARFWASKNPERERANNQKHKRTLKCKFNKLKHRARKRNIEVTLTFEQYCQIVESGKCFYCDEPLPVMGHGVDRIDSSIGYVYSNCRSCCQFCNIMKSDGSEQEFIRRCSKVVDTFKKRILIEVTKGTAQ
jgi:hypothetical protein